MAGALTIPRPRPPTAPLLLGIAALLLFTLSLGQGALWDNDEAFYTEIARQIVTRSDPLTLYWNGHPWFIHPPLYMWLVAGTGALVGFGEFTARVWTAVFGAVGVLVTYQLARRLYNVRTAVLAGLVLMTTLEYFVLSRLAVFDIPLLAFMLLALYAVLVAMDAPTAPARRRAYRWAFVWAGLGTLTKGPIALLLPGVVVNAWWLLRGEWRRRWSELPWEGFFLYGLIGLSWYAAGAVLHGREFLRVAVGQSMFTRFFGVVENQPGPWYFYLPILVVGGFPWSAFLPSAVLFLWRRIRSDRAASLFLLWMGLTLLFYSIAGTKLPNYIVPVFPIAAIGVSRLWTAAVWEGEGRALALVRWGMVLLLGAVGVLVAGVVWYGRFAHPQEFGGLLPHLRLLGLLLAAGSLVTLGLFFAMRPALALTALILTVVVMLGTTVLATLPRVEALRPMKPLALLIGARLQPGGRIVAAGATPLASLVFYTRAPVISARTAEEARRALCGRGGGFLVIDRETYRQWAPPAFGADFSVLAERDDMIVLKQVKPVPCASR